jgi:hypothetical protein
MRGLGDMSSDVRTDENNGYSMFSRYFFGEHKKDGQKDKFLHPKRQRKKAKVFRHFRAVTEN